MSDADSTDSTNEGHFVQLLAKHEPEIRAFIRASLPSSHDVADVMQNVSLIAWKKFRELENAESGFAKWVCVIARFEIMKFRRGLARDRFVLDEDVIRQLCEEGEAETSLRAQQIAQLEVCLSQLPEDRRELVIEAYSPGVSIKELAEQRGKKPDALYQLLRRIRQELEACILPRIRSIEGGEHMNDSDSYLIDAYLDGNLTPEQGESLQQLLRNDPEARAALRRRATIDEGLTDLAAAAAVRQKADEDSSLPGLVSVHGQKSNDFSYKGGSRIRVIIPWAVAGALVLVLLSNWFSSTDPIQKTDPKTESSLGLLVDEAGAEFEDGFGPTDGRFEAGEFRLKSGVIHFQLENKADLVMRSPAAFRIRDAFHLELLSGNLRAIIPPSAEGFTVVAPKVEYEDLGTEFGVSVDRESGTSQIHVFDGQVDAKKAGSQQILSSVTSGQSMRFSDDEWKPAEAPDADEYLTPGEIGFLRWLTWRKRFIQDPSLIAFYSFAHDSNAPNTLANEAGQATNGAINGARWVSGRWPGKEALLFDRDDDFVGLTIPGEFDEITFSFWVTVDRLDYEYNALLNSNGWERGDLHFQIKRTGLAWANVNGKKRSQRVFAGDPIKPGRWQHIVGVISRTDDYIKTYVDGKLVWEQQSELAGPIVPGACSLGNWTGVPEKYLPSRRAFKGRMDEVAIWKRALTKEEIQAHFEAGRPNLIDN